MKISIITCTYNSAKTLNDTIDSIRKQSYKNIEYIVIDGNSNDDTLKLINSSHDIISKYISEPDNGIYDAMNKGIKLSSGDIVGFLNSDDIFNDNNVLTDIFNVFTNYQNIDGVHSELYYTRSNDLNKIIRHWKTQNYYPGAFTNGWHPAHPTLYLKRHVYDKYGYFDVDYKLAADFEIMLRFIEKYKIKLKYITKPTVRMRLGGSTNKNFLNIIKQNYECYKAFIKNDIDFKITYIYKRIKPKLKQFFN